MYDPRSYGYNDYHELDNFPDLSLLPSYLLEQAAENYPTFDDLDDPEELAGYVDLLHSLYMIDLQMSYETIWPETEVFIKTHGIHNLLPFHILAELTGGNEDCLYEHMQTIQSIFDHYPEEEILQCLMHTQSIPCLIASFPVGVPDEPLGSFNGMLDEPLASFNQCWAGISVEQPLEISVPDEKPAGQQQGPGHKKRPGKKQRKKQAKLEAPQL